MLPSKQLERINELARKQKTSGLTDAEKREQQALREEYLRAFRAEFRKHLDHIHIADDGAGGGGDLQ